MTNDTRASVTFREIAPGGVFGAEYFARLLDSKHPFLTSRSIATRSFGWSDLEEAGGNILRGDERGTCGHEYVVHFDGGVVAQLLVGQSLTQVTVSAPDRASASAVPDQLELALGVIDCDPADVNVAFWTGSPRAGGGVMRPRKLSLPRWRDVCGNYAPTARKELEEIMRMPAGARPGVMIWHGSPGTGKTTALRALAREWREWCSVHYIVDLERFIGADSQYLMDVLFAPEVLQPGQQPVEDCDRPVLIVLEDAGQLIGIDAREHSGQAVSRLLNMTDGLIGQTRPCWILITTNEHVGRLHPALLRPGRCVSQIDVPAFEPAAARAWLDRHGAGDVAVSGAMTLADLYAAVGELRRVTSDEPEPVGFRA